MHDGSFHFQEIHPQAKYVLFEGFRKQLTRVGIVFVKLAKYQLTTLA